MRGREREIKGGRPIEREAEREKGRINTDKERWRERCHQKRESGRS